MDINYENLETFLGIEKHKIVPEKNNVFSTCIFIPENLNIDEKTSMYLTGFFKLVETFSKRKPDDTWKLRIYFDKIIISDLSKLYRLHRIKYKSKKRLKTKNNKQKKNKHTLNNNEKGFLNFTKKYNNNNNNNKNTIKFAKGFNDYKYLLNIYKNYINFIIDNNDIYNDIELFSFDCKSFNYKKYSRLGHPQTFGSIIRSLPMFEPNINIMFQINISHTITPFMSYNIKKWVLDSNCFIFDTSVLNKGYNFSGSKYLESIFKLSELLSKKTENNNIETLGDYSFFIKNEIFKNTDLLNVSNNLSNNKKNSFNKILKQRQLAGIYGCKTITSKHNIKYFYHMLYNSIEKYNITKNKDIFSYSVDEYFLTIINYLNHLFSNKSIPKNNMSITCNFSYNIKPVQYSFVYHKSPYKLNESLILPENYKHIEQILKQIYIIIKKLKTKNIDDEDGVHDTISLLGSLLSIIQQKLNDLPIIFLGNFIRDFYINIISKFDKKYKNNSNTTSSSNNSNNDDVPTSSNNSNNNLLKHKEKIKIIAQISNIIFKIFKINILDKYNLDEINEENINSLLNDIISINTKLLHQPQTEQVTSYHRFYNLHYIFLVNDKLNNDILFLQKEDLEELIKNLHNILIKDYHNFLIDFYKKRMKYLIKINENINLNLFLNSFDEFIPLYIQINNYTPFRYETFSQIKNIKDINWEFLKDYYRSADNLIDYKMEELDYVE